MDENSGLALKSRNGRLRSSDYYARCRDGTESGLVKEPGLSSLLLFPYFTAGVPPKAPSPPPSCSSNVKAIPLHACLRKRLAMFHCDGKTTGMKDFLKRAIDLLISIPLVLLLLPLLIVIPLAIRLDSPGPALFAQKRRGKDFRQFTMLKFRSLRHNAPDPHDQYEMLQKDPRITFVGNIIRRTSLDELPQLFNVIAGTMSLVGPRPLVEWESQLTMPHFAERYIVKPGITGLSQLNGRNAISFEARCEFDVEYVHNRSMLGDLLLLLRTPFVLLTTHEIYPTEDSRNKATSSGSIR
jgi:lipopolysaccharide/colanic/teichoic acid biosynthesis glycosyltransferase